MKKRLFIALAIMSGCFAAYAQTDTAFWFAVPRVTPNHESSVIYHLKITSFGQSSNYKVSIPSTGQIISTGTVAANSIVTVMLNRDQLKMENPGVVENKGIKITGSNPITCYFEISGSLNGEIYSLKGSNALGTDFIVPTQKFYDHSPDDWYGANDFTAFDIVATEDGTQVTITPSSNTVNHPANVPFTITLNKGQTYSVRASNRHEYGALGGTIVTTNGKPIAITITEDSIRMGLSFAGSEQGADVIGDQIVPVSVGGKQYIAIRGDISQQLNEQEGVQIWGTVNGTNVTVTYANSSTANFVLNRGTSQYIEIEGAMGTSIYIDSDQPILAYQVAGQGPSSYEVGSAVLPPVICTGSQSVAFTRMTSDGNFYLLLMTTDEYKDDFVFTSGSNTIAIDPVEFKPVMGSAGMVSACINFGTDQGSNGVLVNQQSIVSNTQGVFHLGIINGIASAEGRGTATYGYFSDFGTGVTTTSATTLFPGCDVTLVAEPFMDAYLWKRLPGGEQLSVNDTLILPQGLAGDIDTVSVRTEASGCVNIATYYVQYAEPEAGLDSTICTTQDSVQVDISDNWYRNILWQDGDTMPVKKLGSGKTGITFYDFNNCTKTDSFNIQVVTAPTVTLSDVAVCAGDTVLLDAGVQDAATLISWSTGATTNAIQVTSMEQAEIQVDVTVREPLCNFSNTDNATISFSNQGVANTITHYSSCSFTYKATPAQDSYKWYLIGHPDSIISSLDSVVFNSIDTSRIADTLIAYSLLGVCITNDTFIVNYTLPDAGDVFNICAGGSVSLDASTNYETGKSNYFDRVLWDDGSTMVSRTIGSDGAYWVDFFDGQCQKRDTFNITIIPAPVVDLGPDQTICVGDTIVLDAGDHDNCTFVWSNGATTDTIEVTSSLPGNVTYSVTVTNECGEKGNDNVQVRYQLPGTSHTDTSYNACFVTLKATPGFQTWQWSTGETGVDSIVIYDADSSKTVDTVFVLMTGGICPSVDTFIVNYRLPEAGREIDLCMGGEAKLDVSQGSNYYKRLEWYFETNNDSVISTADSIVADATGRYTVMFFDKHGCSKPAYYNVEIEALPQPDLGPDVEFCPENTTLLDAGYWENCSYLWSTGDTIQIITAASTEAKEVNYVVTVTTPICKYEVQAQVKVDFLNCEIIPYNVFTPNGDGINDKWVVENVENRVWVVVIYNRWGKKVYENNDYNNDWDGGDASDGVYYYIIRTYEIDVEPLQGYVHIVRGGK